MATPPRPSWVYRLTALLSLPVVFGLFRLRSQGRERLPAEGGYVLAANHSSNFDPWALGLPLFPRRYLRFMGKSELFWTPFKQFATAAGAFPVRRGQHDTEAIDTAIALCREGHVVVMFPEGTRRRKGMRKRHEARPHSGAARIALGAGVPLQPAAIRGTDRLARLGPLRVVYGEAVSREGLPADEREAAQELTERLMASIAELEAVLDAR